MLQLYCDIIIVMIYAVLVETLKLNPVSDLDKVYKKKDVLVFEAQNLFEVSKYLQNLHNKTIFYNESTCSCLKAVPTIKLSCHKNMSQQRKNHFCVNQANGTTFRSASTSFVALRVEAELRVRKLSRLFVEHI